jgi:hypothetical protein
VQFFMSFEGLLIWAVVSFAAGVASTTYIVHRAGKAKTA